MIEVAENVFQISVFPRHAVNVYLIGPVLVDAGVRGSGRQILRAVAGRPLSAHVLTHAHADHQGASAQICAARGVPLWCGAPERRAAETGQVTAVYANPRHPVARLQQRFWAGPGHPVSRLLSEGDQIAGFEVIETPGHARGHLAFWRARDGVLIAGDVLVAMDLLTTRPGLHEPPALYTHDAAENRRSIQKLARLNPRLVCCGHGPVLREPAALQEFAARLAG